MTEIIPIAILSNLSRLRKRRALGLLLVAILVGLSLHWPVFQSREVVSGVIARPLGECDVELFGRRGDLIVLACPHTDFLKLWPLPVEQPWFENLPTRIGEGVL